MVKKQTFINNYVSTLRAQGSGVFETHSAGPPSEQCQCGGDRRRRAAGGDVGADAGFRGRDSGVWGRAVAVPRAPRGRGDLRAGRGSARLRRRNPLREARSRGRRFLQELTGMTNHRPAKTPTADGARPATGGVCPRPLAWQGRRGGRVTVCGVGPLLRLRRAAGLR